MVDINDKRQALVDILIADDYSEAAANATVDDILTYDHFGPAVEDMSPEEILQEYVRDQKFDEALNSPAFKLGSDLGYSLGLYDSAASALAAYDAGEIDLWADYQRPKTMEEWDEWYAEHGSHEEWRGRWTRKTRRDTE